MDNPYWDAVEEFAKPGDWPYDGGMMVGNLLGLDRDLWHKRHEYASKWAWTITDPDSVLFVASYAGRIVDPMAGTGYWGYLLAQTCVDIVSYDLGPGTNHWHGGETLHSLVEEMDGPEAAHLHPDRALLLAWPPMDDAGARTLARYRGDRVIYIGESRGGCTGDEDLHDALRRDWNEVAYHRPVQWWGVHDDITVYDRR